MKGTWDNESTLDITCPECGHETKELISKLQQNKSVICAGCGVNITINGDGLDTLESLKNAIEGLG